MEHYLKRKKNRREAVFFGYMGKDDFMFIVTVDKMENIPKLKEAGADAIILGVEGYSIRQKNQVSLQRIKEWKSACEKAGIFLYVNFLKFFSEPEMEMLMTGLQVCKDEGVDGIYYGDEGVYYLAEKLGIEHLLIYQPETLVTNAQDVQFYLDQGLQAVSLAHELSIDEIESIASCGRNIEVLIHGYFSILYSRRPLISNYCAAIGKELPSNRKVFDLIESTRNERMPIIEDKTGVHIFSEDVIESFDFIKQLSQSGIERFRIDSIFKDDEWTCDVLRAYMNCLSGKDFVRMEGSDRWYRQNTLKRKDG